MNKMALKNAGSLLMLLVAAVVFLGADSNTVRAGAENEPPSVELTVAHVPSCSYGYSQCRKGCGDQRKSSESLKAFLTRENTCIQDCNFLYSDCNQ